MGEDIKVVVLFYIALFNLIFIEFIAHQPVLHYDGYKLCDFEPCDDYCSILKLKKSSDVASKYIDKVNEHGREVMMLEYDGLHNLVKKGYKEDCRKELYT